MKESQVLYTWTTGDISNEETATHFHIQYSYLVQRNNLSQRNKLRTWIKRSITIFLKATNENVIVPIRVRSSQLIPSTYNSGKVQHGPENPTVGNFGFATFTNSNSESTRMTRFFFFDCSKCFTFLLLTCTADLLKSDHGHCEVAKIYR